MAEISIIAAQRRERAGKGPARAARRAGRVPGVIYGSKKDPSMVTLDPRELDRELQTGAFLATIYDVQIDRDKERVLPRDVQFDPVTDRPIHVDFLRVSATSSVTVQVPVNFLNEEESPGLRRGGLLNVVRHEIEMNCLADAIPSSIDIDLAGLDIGDSVHISMISLPDGVAPTITDRDFTIATIAAPTVVQEAAEAEEGAELEEGAEPEEGAEEGAAEDTTTGKGAEE
ncbi:MAG: 50S ribosomal protein L25/general stress protein Ctc [Alphaproteobacteria bacterium]|nr:MAG: 50S ribosomal protein L25/general stress protein Ctc [Alphaproteobacteria bacterium]